MSSPWARTRVLPVLLVGAFMPTLDFFIVNVAIPSIRKGLDATSGEIELVVAIYAVVYASLLVLGGRLGDRWGHRRAFLAGMAMFTASSVLCGVTWGIWPLIVARALQGGSAAVVFPQVLALIQMSYQGTDRQRAVMWYAVALGTAAGAGQLLGGSLISLDLLGWSWRWVFLVNLPVGLVTVPLARAVLPPAGTAGHPSFDRVGALLCGTGLILLVLPLTVGRSAGWPAWSWVLLACSVAVLAGFWWWERRRERAGGEALLPPGLLGARTMRVGLLIVFAFYASLASFLFVLAVQLQQGQGLSPIESGLVSCPLAIGFLIASLVGRPLSVRWGTAPLAWAMVAQFLGYAGQIWLVSADPRSVNLFVFMLLLTVNGVCTGLVMAPLLGLVLTGVPPARTGAASGLLATAQQVAGAVGLAIIGVLFFASSSTDAAGISHGYRRGLFFLAATALATLAGLLALGRARTADTVTDQPPRERRVNADHDQARAAVRRTGGSSDHRG